MEESLNEIQDLLVMLFKNGQITNANTPVIQTLNNEITVYTTVYEEDSLEAKYSNKYIKATYEKLKELNIDIPTISILGKDPTISDSCNCEKKDTYILFAHYLSIDSPLTCGYCFRSIPLYKIPYLHDFEYLDILSWQKDYKACDTLQMHCCVGERFGT